MGPVEGLLVLADGTVFEGEAIGWWPEQPVPATGEVVFNTTLTGYQEVLTDPSYAGQIVCFTYPHIGNYGVTRQDNESRRAFCRGLIVREVAPRPSSWRSEQTLGEFLQAERLPGMAGLDTRRLTRHIREAGAMPAAFGPVAGPGALAETDLKEAALRAPGTDGVDLASEVTTPEPYTVGDGPLRVVAYDFGIKTAILDHLGRLATVDVVPASTPAAEVLARKPDGVFLSNGPGDPAAVGYAVESIRGLLGEVPVFGICLGHQLMATALGARTYKLPFGHHGGNHPVRRISTGSVEITSQNHNYAVVDGSVQGADVSHVNLNDGVVEGLACRDIPAFSVQYHPEAGPGPHDASYLFDEFQSLMEKSR
ncbi:MAG TPA: glutamine-hydrolyzing carbamoyl-phosphate synthase small subunit [Acidimicrobiales bacterium]|nr:glutamine-hydrolyzing carbamoyl-phosphate synthase small subunit [Acidimicrobiales bacterium]